MQIACVLRDTGEAYTIAMRKINSRKEVTS